ncbi:MAG: dipeptide epimerase [Candidatus Krumholzibacteria bacterium]|nr:dipeptide epimerase [Candidatus Krumholzibacteria bacterium]
MTLDVEPIRIETAHPFQIARGTRRTYEVFVVSLTHEGVTGWGEAAPQAYYGEDPMTVRGAVNAIGRLLSGEPEALRLALHDPGTPLGSALARHASVRAALDMALWDMRGKREGRPCCELFGGNPAQTPLTSYTIGFDRPEVVDRKVDAAGPYRILKVKVGLPGDLEILDRVLARSGKKVRVDANEGWDLEMALDRTRELHQRGVEFCEQPIPHADEEGLRELKRLSPLTIILDESVVGPDDVAARADQGHGINIKLMKCGGITPALRMIETARRLGLRVMLGCMIETSLGVTAAAHLSPLADYADLDGNLLLAEDPFAGVGVVEGKLVLPMGPGLGVARRT